MNLLISQCVAILPWVCGAFLLYRIMPKYFRAGPIGILGYLCKDGQAARMQWSAGYNGRKGVESKGTRNISKSGPATGSQNTTFIFLAIGAKSS